MTAILPPLPATPWQPDLGDGRYQNPILHADYSDPDVVRVGNDYWMTASSFSHVPGLPLLHSRDLVNWELTGHALPRLVPEEAFRAPQHGKGVWAPSLRFHAGKYWIYYPDPDFGIYVITAIDPQGEWSTPVLVKGGQGLIDPCPLWDDDGQVYLIHAWAKSRAGINNVLTLLRLSADGLKVEEDLGVVIDGHQLPNYLTIEGPKFFQRNGWYYIFAPAGGVATGWQSVFRSRNIRGPYEDRIVLAQGSTPINGPHQGALVDTPTGEWWFLHFQDKEAYGRIVHLQPVTWRDDWPLMGTGVKTGEMTGEPVLTHPKPNLPEQTRMTPATSDEFDSPRPFLAPQWQWQANPAADWYSLTQSPGALRLFAQTAPGNGNLFDVPNLLLQKFPALEFAATTQIDFTARSEGDEAGLIVFGYDYAWLGLKRRAGHNMLVYSVCLGADKGGSPHETVIALPSGAEPGRITLRVSVRAEGHCEFAYALNGTDFSPVEVPVFTASVGQWVGAKVGLFALGAAGTHADFDWIRFTPLVR